MLLLDVRLLLYVLVYYYLYIIQNCYYFNFGKITKTLFSAKLENICFCGMSETAENMLVIIYEHLKKIENTLKTPYLTQTF